MHISLASVRLIVCKGTLAHLRPRRSQFSLVAQGRAAQPIKRQAGGAQLLCQRRHRRGRLRLRGRGSLRLVLRRGESGLVQLGLKPFRRGFHMLKQNNPCDQ